MRDVSASTNVFELAESSTWPAEVHDLIEKSLATKDIDELGSRACNDLFVDAMGDGLVRFYHCTRLTEREISDIKSEGLRLLTPEFAKKRISNLVIDGHLTPDEGRMYATSRYPSDPSRRGRIHLAGYRPDLAKPREVSHLLSIWGGEGINHAWKSDSGENRRLEQIGTPSIVLVILPPHTIDSTHPGWLIAAASVAVGDPKGLTAICTNPIGVSHIEEVNHPGSPWWEQYIRWTPRGWPRS